MAYSSPAGQSRLPLEVVNVTAWVDHSSDALAHFYLELSRVILGGIRQ